MKLCWPPQGSRRRRRPFALSVPEVTAAGGKTFEKPTPKLAIVWAFAPGHAVSNRNIWRQFADDKAAEPLVIKLPAAADISFVVTTPDGQARRGSKNPTLG